MGAWRDLLADLTRCSTSESSSGASPTRFRPGSCQRQLITRAHFGSYSSVSSCILRRSGLNVLTLLALAISKRLHGRATTNTLEGQEHASQAVRDGLPVPEGTKTQVIASGSASTRPRPTKPK